MWIVAPFNNSITTNVKNGTIKVATTTKPILSVVSLFLIVLIKFDIVFVFILALLPILKDTIY